MGTGGCEEVKEDGEGDANEDEDWHGVIGMR